MQSLITAVMLLSVLSPTKGWFGANQPVTVQVKSEQPVRLVLTDFAGKAVEGTGGPAQADAGATVDLRKVFPGVFERPGTYILYAVPAAVAEQSVGQPVDQFLGTPLVIEARRDRRRGAAEAPLVIRVTPLRYAVMDTQMGPMKMIFYYDVAPATVDMFLRLAEEGFYDGLTFHRVVPDFVVQGGDPLGDGSGGPGFFQTAEFSDRRHERGTLSLARAGDPGENAGIMPRPEFANSGSSQFFIVLNDDAGTSLDGRYTAFGKVVSGIEAADRMAALPLIHPARGLPVDPPVTNKVEIRPVTAQDNPYRELMADKGPTTGPATAPAAEGQ